MNLGIFHGRMQSSFKSVRAGACSSIRGFNKESGYSYLKNELLNLLEVKYSLIL